METLVIINQSPYGNWSGREALDMAFSLAAFDQPVALFFSGDGVNWLRKSQEADAVAQKSVEKNLSAATIFGVSALIADQQACERFGLEETNMISGVSMAELNPDLFAGYHHVVNLT